MHAFKIRHLVIFLWVTLGMGGFYSVHAHGDGHSHEASPVVVKEQKQSAPQRYAKSGKDFEVVLVLPETGESVWTAYVSDPISNRPIGNASVSLSLDHKNKINFDKTNAVGVYQKNIPTEHGGSISLFIKKQHFEERFVFNETKPSNDGMTSGRLGSSLAILGGVLIILGVFFVRKRKTSLIILLCFGNYSLPSQGHGGEEHFHPEDSAEDHEMIHTASGVKVPKEIQFHLGIVTQKVRSSILKSTVRLVGRVISDPSGFARLQATQSARIINTPEYPLPFPGQKVKKDQVVMILQPTLNKVESTDQRSILYKVESEIVQLKKDVARKEKLGQFVSKKDLENTRTELVRAQKQKEEILTKTFKPEYLRSPLDGIVDDLHVRPGEIVSPEKTIVEIIDPTKLLVEALVFNPVIADNIISGTARLPLTPHKSIPLEVIGVSPKVSTEDQSIHVLFKAKEQDPSIKLDMAVEVLGNLRTTKPTIVIPKKAVVEDAKGAWVYLHTDPEVFKARKVRILRTFGEKVEIESGLSVGQKIVVDGTYLLHQAK